MSNNNSPDPRGRAQNRIAIFKRKILEYIQKNSIPEESSEIIDQLMGLRGRSALLLFSDMEARLEASDRLSALLRDKRDENPDMAFHFFTFTDESGFVSDRATIVDVKSILDKAGRALRSLKLNAVAVLEIHPLANYPGAGAGRTLLFHVHAIGWADTTFDPKEAEEALMAGGAWKNPLGAPPIKIKPIASTNEDLEEVSRYALKAPHSAKNRRPRKKDPTRFQLMNTIKGYRPEFACRMLEVLSQIEMLDVVIGVGDGKRIRQNLRKSMTDWHRDRPSDGAFLPGEFDIWHFWFQLRQSIGSKLFLPVRITGGGYRMRPIKSPKKKKARRVGIPKPKWHKQGAPRKRTRKARGR